MIHLTIDIVHYEVSASYEEYKKQRNKNKQMRKKAKREYEKKLLKRFKDKPKLFYSYVRNKQKVKPEIPQLNTGDGIMTSSDEEIAQEFGEKNWIGFHKGN